MTAALAYALRRTSARVVLAVGAFGILWTVWMAGPFDGFVSMKASTMPLPRGVYRFLWSGFSAADIGAAVLVAAVALAAAVLLWRGRAITR